MKMLKKLAALILAATMVLVLFTACGGCIWSKFSKLRPLPLTLLQMFRNIRSSMESMTLCAGVFRNQISMGLHLPVFI